MIRRLVVALLFFAAIAVSFSVGATTAERSRVGVLDEAVKAILENGSNPIDEQLLRRAAVEGMLRVSGDRWSSYYEREEFSSFSAALSGRYTGVGIWLRPGASGGVEVASVQSGSPARAAGVLSGDSLVAVDGVDTSSANVATVVGLLRGDEGTNASLRLVRNGEVLAIAVTRATLSSADVEIDRSVSKVLIIRVSAFTQGVGAEVNQAVETLKHPGGVILDLRGNAGGLLEEARQVASAFLDGGVVAAYERRGKEARILRADIGGDTKAAVVVMVDTATASAAEVVAGALQDRNRAVLVGERTYGKGSVQEPQMLSDGSAIELTVGRYRTPTGRYLEGVGLDPDVRAVGQDAEKRALQVLSALSTVAGPGGRG
jgi:carboxyl-terminal processing protease